MFSGPYKALAQSNPSILPGATRLDLYLPLLKGKRVGIFANQTSTIGKVHLIDSLLNMGVVISKIFSPEHGLRGTADAGEKIYDSTDPRTHIPIVSLYGVKQKPSSEDLQNIDILIFDIQDVGVRFYTYISSLQRFLESAIENKLPLVILDRPNPNGFYVDGPVLDLKFRSFVGLQPIPIVYGMTEGEFAKMLLGEKWLEPKLIDQLDYDQDVKKSDDQIKMLERHVAPSAPLYPAQSFRLFVIPCQHYTHQSRYILPIKPSPNLPNMRAVYLYPSLCLFEGTIISVGRGTDKPFQLFGGPTLPADLFAFVPKSTDGAKSPPFLDQTCFGFDLSEAANHDPLASRINLFWLLEAYRLCKEKTQFFLPSNYFNKLAGNDLLMQQIKDRQSEDQIRSSWELALSRFKATRKKYLIYKDFE